MITSPRSTGATAVGITLAPGPGRITALLVAGLPLVVILVIGVVTASGGGTPSGYGGLPGSGGLSGVTPAQSAAGPTPAADGADQTPAGVQGDSYSASPGSASPGSAFGAVTPTAADGPGSVPATVPVSVPGSVPATSASVSASPVVTGPAGTVTAAYAAVNRRDYATAYALGLDVSGEPYATFVQGFSGTAHDALTIVGVAGGTVTVTLAATNKDGSEQTFAGTYTVSDGHITGADMEQTG